MSEQWQSSPFGCFSNFYGCLYGLCCPCYMTAASRTKFDGSDPFFNLNVLTPCMARNIIREGYGIEGNCIGDCCWTTFCCPCVTCQLYNETQRRGKVKDSHGRNDQQWTNNLMGCMNIGCGQCLYAWCCPCCAMASARNTYDDSNWCFNCMCLSLPLGRNIIREGYSIKGECFSDVCVSCCCGPCAVAQLLGEVNARGMVNAGAKANQVA